MQNQDLILLKNVRVAFPCLFEKANINGVEGKYGAKLLLHPDAHEKSLNQIKEALGQMVQKNFKGQKLQSDKLCIRKGSETSRTEFEPYYVLSANTNRQPLVFDARKELIYDIDKCAIYSGCYVNAKVSLWAQNNHYGKRINANLVSIQFAADGDSFGGSSVSVEEAGEGFDGGEDGMDDFME